MLAVQAQHRRSRWLIGFRNPKALSPSSLGEAVVALGLRGVVRDGLREKRSICLTVSTLSISRSCAHQATCPPLLTTTPNAVS